MGTPRHTSEGQHLAKVKWCVDMRALRGRKIWEEKSTWVLSRFPGIGNTEYAYILHPKRVSDVTPAAFYHLRGDI